MKISDQVKNIPNFLTILRIALVPILIASFYIYHPIGRYISIAIFIFASITDYFDGLLARTLDAQTHFGRLLDPIADKILVVSTLMMLVAKDEASVIPIIVIVSRELFVSGLREYLAQLHCSLPVTLLSKAKTALQMVAIIVMMFKSEIAFFSYHFQIGDVLLWIVACLTLISGYSYCKLAFSKLIHEDANFSNDDEININY